MTDTTNIDGMAAKLVRRLQWDEPGERNNWCWTARTVLGVYSVVDEGGVWCAGLDEGVLYWEWEPETDPRSFSGPGPAQQACEAHYLTRIRSALDLSVVEALVRQSDDDAAAATALSREVFEFSDRAETAEATVASQALRIKELEGALKPFVGKLHPVYNDAGDDKAITISSLTVGDFRRARSAYEGGGR